MASRGDSGTSKLILGAVAALALESPLPRLRMARRFSVLAERSGFIIPALLPEEERGLPNELERRGVALDLLLFLVRRRLD